VSQREILDVGGWMEKSGISPMSGRRKCGRVEVRSRPGLAQFCPSIRLGGLDFHKSATGQVFVDIEVQVGRTWVTCLLVGRCFILKRGGINHENKTLSAYIPLGSISPRPPPEAQVGHFCRITWDTFGLSFIPRLSSGKFPIFSSGAARGLLLEPHEIGAPVPPPYLLPKISCAKIGANRPYPTHSRSEEEPPRDTYILRNPSTSG